MTTEEFDVLVVGGGVIGCATTFHLTNLGYKCLLAEKNADLLAEASCGNSGMLHTGFDAPANSLELSCIKSCQAKVYNVLDKLGITYNRVGATMVAWDENQGQNMLAVKRRADIANIPDVIPISLSELYQMEPNLRRNAHSALWIPGETVTDPWSLPISLAHHAYRRGAQIRRNCKVEHCEKESYGPWTVSTNQGPIKCKSVINCAGLHGDTVDNYAGKDNFNILPRKGDYIVYDALQAPLISSSIIPVPSGKSKGVIIFKSVYNNLIVGPTAEDVQSRRIPAVDPIVQGRLTQFAKSTVPRLANYPIIGGYTGVRSATQYKDYQIISDSDRQWITVGGIRSTGVSGSLGIAEHVGNLVEDDLHLEPSQGRSLLIDRVDLAFKPAQKVASVDGCQYTITHPIVQFGKTVKSHL